MKCSPVTNKPYLNDAIIGNSSMLAALGTSGEIHRLWWPHVDTPQHIEKIRAGILLHDAHQTVWLDEASEWTHEQSYLPKTNVLVSKATGTKLPLTVQSTDFAVPDKDLLVRHYELTNTSDAPVSLQFIYYANLTICENRLYNTVTFEPKIDGLLFFRHQYAFALSGANVCAGYTAKNALEEAEKGALSGVVIDMGTDGALSYQVEIEPGATVSLPIYLACGTTLAEATAAMEEAKSESVGHWLTQTSQYWTNYVNELTGKKPVTTDDTRITEIYERSLLVFKLMSDSQTGSVIAAPEFDEAFTRCGGYAFCWGRDAAYITTAFDRAGLSDLTRDFYRWALIAQDADGSWQQRHYHDGRLAPSWGLQIDEGASILWGMYQHYLATGDRSFLEEVWTAVEKGTTFLLNFLDAETGLPLPSMDLWEERAAEHTYSSAAVFGGITGAASIAQELGKTELADAWNQAAANLKDSILTHTVREDNTFYRGVKLAVNEETYNRAEAAGKKVYKVTDEKGYVRHNQYFDEIYDISLIGVTVPFNLIDANDPRAAATADAIERTCTSPKVGGIRRYEDDPYIGGNPWILTTLWLAQFRILQGQYDEAKKHLEWAVTHATSLSLLPEQIDKETGETAWVVPLTWSHAMFVLTVHMLQDAGQL
ncbi:glycoside hydrolase family 15 protein [Brevibacillus dissolubilis]|uniref:glycoside hydrolase family 15 protein n=1 Tax=Brevibacillus dissolubilis TaxID=1844116 RepID=UPI001115CAC0|nr:glycoside hydrolase family 15 protein [Brevibacillus dissolubilis]